MKEKMVTRTVKMVRVEMLIFNKGTNETFNRVFEIPKKSCEKEILKAINEIIGVGFKALTILSQEPFEKMYGMTENEFIRIASELDDKRRIITTEINE